MILYMEIKPFLRSMAGKTEEKRKMQIIKNAIENVLWVAMFIPLWPIDSQNKARLALSLDYWRLFKHGRLLKNERNNKELNMLKIKVLLLKIKVLAEILRLKLVLLLTEIGILKPKPILKRVEVDADCKSIACPKCNGTINLESENLCCSNNCGVQLVQIVEE